MPDEALVGVQQIPAFFLVRPATEEYPQLSLSKDYNDQKALNEYITINYKNIRIQTL